MNNLKAYYGLEKFTDEQAIHTIDKLENISISEQVSKADKSTNITNKESYLNNLK